MTQSQITIGESFEGCIFDNGVDDLHGEYPVDDIIFIFEMIVETFPADPAAIKQILNTNLFKRLLTHQFFHFFCYRQFCVAVTRHI